MSSLFSDSKTPEELFWDELNDARSEMLGCEGSGHLQPMAPITYWN